MHFSTVDQVLRVLIELPPDFAALQSIRFFARFPLATGLLGPVDVFEHGEEHSKTVLHLHFIVSGNRSDA